MAKQATKSKSSRKARKTARPKAFFQSVAVVVSDRAKSKQWYTETFGLDPLDQMDHWVTVGRRGNGGRLHLCQTNEYEPGAKLEPGNTGILLVVPGDYRAFQTACVTWKAAGVKFVQDPEKKPWGWWASVVDPDGNEIHLVPDR